MLQNVTILLIRKSIWLCYLAAKYAEFTWNVEFELNCDNLALCWLLKRVKEIGRLGRWVLCLAPFTFRVKHTCECDNVVADALSCILRVKFVKANLLESLPSVYSSIESHQADDPFIRMPGLN